jgi:predicted ATPase
LVLHCRGDQSEARPRLEHVLQHYVPPVHRAHILRYQYDQRVSARTTLSLVQWLQGFPDQAVRSARATVDDALSTGHMLSICSALANTACPLSIMSGDLVAAEHYVELLLEYARKHGIAVWHTWGQCYYGMLVIKRGEVEGGIRKLREALKESHTAGLALRYSAFQTELAETLGRAGSPAIALSEVGEALKRAERNDERWCISEMLRVKGELELILGSPKEKAESLFNESIFLAQRQGALSWELRAVTSLAKLQAGTGRVREARNVLAVTYSKFTEGFDTVDLVLAKTIIDSLVEQ